MRDHAESARAIIRAGSEAAAPDRALRRAMTLGDGRLAFAGRGYDLMALILDGG
jgi:hypothetical protein